MSQSPCGRSRRTFTAGSDSPSARSTRPGTGAVSPGQRSSSIERLHDRPVLAATSEYTRRMIIAGIIFGSIVLLVIIAMVTRFRSGDQLDSGGSYGRQFGKQQEDEPPEDA